MSDAKAMIAEAKRRHIGPWPKHDHEGHEHAICLAHDLAVELEKVYDSEPVPDCNAGCTAHVSCENQALRKRVEELEEADWKRRHPFVSDASNSMYSFKVEDD